MLWFTRAYRICHLLTFLISHGLVSHSHHGLQSQGPPCASSMDHLGSYLKVLALVIPSAKGILLQLYIKLTASLHTRFKSNTTYSENLFLAVSS